MELIKILNNDLDGLTEEEKGFAEEFNNRLKKDIIDELVKYDTDKFISTYNNSISDYYDMISQLMNNGIKGYKYMNLKQLIDIYLSKKSDEDFINLINREV